MRIEVQQGFSFLPTRENGYGYTELVALPNGKAIGLSCNTSDRIYRLQIFEGEEVRYLNFPEDLFDNSTASNVLFALGNQPVVLTRKLFVIFVSEGLNSFEVSVIQNSSKVFTERELDVQMPQFGLHSANSVNGEVLLSMSYSSLHKQNEIIKVSIAKEKLSAELVPLYSTKTGFLKKTHHYRGSLNLEQFPKNFGYPTWSSAPILYSILNLEDHFLIFSCGDWLVKGSGHSYNCISQITNDLVLKEHLYVENYHRNSDGKHLGKFGVFSSDCSHCIVTPKYKKKDENNWFGKQKVFVLATNAFEDILLPRGYTKYSLLDINGQDCWLEYWDKVKKVKNVVRGKRK